MSEMPIDQLMAHITHPLHHIICPTCSTRFGMERTEVQFVEQTQSEVWCPRGHELRLVVS